MPGHLDAAGSPAPALTVVGVRGIGEVVAGSGVARLVVDALARDGVPAGTTDWPRFDTAGRATRILDRACTVVHAPRRAAREGWGS